MLGVSVSKFHELVSVVENKDPYGLHVRLEQTPTASKFHQTHNITLESKPISLTMTLAGSRGPSYSLEALGLR